MLRGACCPLIMFSVVCLWLFAGGHFLFLFLVCSLLLVVVVLCFVVIRSLGVVVGCVLFAVCCVLRCSLLVVR